jgi:hypothetical protein
LFVVIVVAPVEDWAEDGARLPLGVSTIKSDFCPILPDIAPRIGWRLTLGFAIAI